MPLKGRCSGSFDGISDEEPPGCKSVGSEGKLWVSPLIGFNTGLEITPQIRLQYESLCKPAPCKEQQSRPAAICAPFRLRGWTGRAQG